MSTSKHASVTSIDRPPQPAPSRPAPRLGIIGAGQLARMTAMAAAQLGCEVVVLAAHHGEPACALATSCVIGDNEDPRALAELAAAVDVITLENEFIDADCLAVLERQGASLYPSSRCMALVQDKYVQKSLLSTHGIAMPRFRALSTPAELEEAAREFAWPVVLKARRNGYDGKGNATVRSAADIEPAWTRLGGAARGLYVEQWCPFVAEVAVIVSRGRDGISVAYPVTETIQREHICHQVLVPAAVAAACRKQIVDLAQRAVIAVDGVGSFGVEMFLLADGSVVFNELAPRVHNSGHYTIEACSCSQFENHVRAVFGWPLGSTAMRAPAAVMINLLGQQTGVARAHGLANALAVPDTHIHLYGKTLVSPGRKMGHITALGADVATARARAERAASAITLGPEDVS